MFTVRHMIARDLPELARIEQAGFGDAGLDENGLDRLAATKDMVPWTATDYAHDLPVGHLFYRLKKRTVEILRVAVSPAHQRCGVGRILLAKAMSKVVRGDRESVTILLPDSALPGAHRWLVACRWRQGNRDGDSTWFFYDAKVAAAA